MIPHILGQQINTNLKAISDSNGKVKGNNPLAIRILQGLLIVQLLVVTYIFLSLGGWV